MYRRDAMYGKDSSVVTRTQQYALPLRRKRSGAWWIPSGEEVFLCMTSDFFLEEADGWRREIWQMIRQRQDLFFCIVTKRIERFWAGLPEDWGDGYGNVMIYVTCENQTETDRRLPVFLTLPVRHKGIIHEPMLEEISAAPYLASRVIEEVICGGESGPDSRLCDYDWILHTREECRSNNVRFIFRQTGRLFRKDGLVYEIPRRLQMAQARKAGIDLV